MKSGSNLEKILESGQFAVTGELGPPKSADPNIIKEKAAILKGFVDAANITDCQTAVVRMSSISVGTMLLELGLEPIIQMTCRDRNRIAIQSDLLGAAALGMKNLLCLTGDHQIFGNHPQSKNVFDLDSMNLLAMVKGMRDDKIFECGDEMEVEPRFLIGAAANPFADPFEYRVQRLAKKIEAGADFIQTQIVFNVEKFSRWMESAKEMGLTDRVNILAGVSPLRSVGMAKYMKNNVPGMDVPDEFIERMSKADNPQEEGIQICVDVINQVKEIEGCTGVHIMAIEWESAVPKIVEKAGLLPRPEKS